MVLDEGVSDVAHALAASVGTGDIGDRKVFIPPVDDAIEIRTGEVGTDAA